MAGSNGVVDLDILRPDPKVLRLGGNDIDVSFVPCGITFELEQMTREMASMVGADMETDREAGRKGFELAIDLCSLFCQRKYPTMTREWFLENTDAGQIMVFAEAIKAALLKSYEGVDRYQRNPRKAKAKMK